MPDVSHTCFFQHAGECGLLLTHERCSGAVLRRYVVLGHLQAILLGQVLDGFYKCHACMVHQKADGIAVFAAAKAVVELLGRADTEGR